VLVRLGRAGETCASADRYADLSFESGACRAVMLGPR
jgi:hypothetical protein